jgi:hypothetical protein
MINFAKHVENYSMLHTEQVMSDMFLFYYWRIRKKTCSDLIINMIFMNISGEHASLLHITYLIIN